MGMRVSAKRYAQAVFEIAKEENLLDEWWYSLKRISEVMQDAELRVLLENPKLPFDLKRQLLEKCLEGVIPSALNLTYLLVSKRRIEIAHLIEVEYKSLLDAYNGIEQAKVITAVPLDDKGKEIIIHRLESLTGHKVVVNLEVDPNIVGGVIVKIGDKLIDGSVKTKLVTLKKSLVHTEK